MDTSASISTINLALDAARVAGETRSGLITMSQTLFDRVNGLLEARNESVLESYPNLSDITESVHEYLSATDAVNNAHSLVAEVQSVVGYTEAIQQMTRNALVHLAALGAAEIPASVLPESNSLPDVVVDPDLTVRTLLSLDVLPSAPDVYDTQLAAITRERLWALHALVLLAIADATPDPGADNPNTVRSDVEQRVRDLRDSMRNLAAELQSTQRAGPAWLLSLIGLVDETETWIRGEGAAAVASACAATDVSDTARSRNGALAYDAARELLALSSGAWAVLRAAALGNSTALSAFAASSNLPLSRGTLDLPRSSITEALGAASGTVVEVDGIVRDSAITVGGPSPRSVLSIGTETGAQLRVLVPFTAVDSFGVLNGVWIQVRGEMFADGKDDLTGPILQCRRIQRKVASTVSFFDNVIWLGRGEFELRPGGLDISAGRIPGDQRTIDELGLRRDDF